MRKLALIMIAVSITALIAVQAFAASMPSSKVVVGGGTITALGKATADTDTTTSDPLADDTGWVSVIKSYIKVPNDKGLSAIVSLQSGLCTFTEVKSKRGAKDTSEATGTIRVRVKLTDMETGDESYAEPSEGGNPDNGVTYNHRLQKLSATFQGLIEDCIDSDGHITITDDCLDPEVVSLLLETLTANSFCFYYGPTNSGVYKIEVQARAQASAALFDSAQGSAKGEAYVGLGSFVCETVRLIHDSEYGGIVELP